MEEQGQEECKEKKGYKEKQEGRMAQLYCAGEGGGEEETAGGSEGAGGAGSHTGHTGAQSWGWQVVF